MNSLLWITDSEFASVTAHPKESHHQGVKMQLRRRSKLKVVKGKSSKEKVKAIRKIILVIDEKLKCAYVGLCVGP